MSVTVPLDRDRANGIVKESLEIMETVDEYVDEESHIVATQKASGFGAGNAAKLTIKFWPDDDSTRIEYEIKKGNPLDLTTDTDEIEEEFQRSIQQVRDTLNNNIEQREHKKESESTGATTVKDAVGEATEKFDQSVEQAKEELDSGPSIIDQSPSTVEQNEETSFRERVNEHLDEEEAGTDSNQSVTEGVSEIQGDQSGSEPRKLESTDDGIGVTDAILALIFISIGLWFIGNSIGLL